jgi:hypothetical protein
MITRAAATTIAVLMLALGGCARECLIGPGDCEILNSYSEKFTLCGFPADHVVQHFGPEGVLREGERIPVTLQGPRDKVRSIRWEVVDGHIPAMPGGPVARFVETSDRGAVLLGVTAGAPDSIEWVFATATITFRDGSESSYSPSNCAGNSIIPVQRFRVNP